MPALPAMVTTRPTGTLAWQSWNTLYVTTSGATSLTTSVQLAESTWQAWNTNITGTTGTLAYQNTAVGIPVVWGAWNTTFEESTAHRRAREQFEAEQQRQAGEAGQRAARYRQERALASTRATDLLLSLLSDEQAASYQEKGYFEVVGSRGGRWRIRNNGQAGNVDLMPVIGEERQATYCAHPPEGLPDADAHLAQMLQLVTDEDAFKRTANLRYTRRAA